MAKKRRSPKATRARKNTPRRTRKKSRQKSLKETLLTTGIWALGLLNVFLIFSSVSNFFASPNEGLVSMRPAEALQPIPNESITVEVRNACGVQGLANEVTQYLRKHKFDVVQVGNYEGGFDVDQTLVLDRVSLNAVNAAKVAEVLGVNSKQVVPDLEDSLQLKVTVIIGKNYKEMKLFQKE